MPLILRPNLSQLSTWLFCIVLSFCPLLEFVIAALFKDTFTMILLSRSTTILFGILPLVTTVLSVALDYTTADNYPTDASSGAMAETPPSSSVTVLSNNVYFLPELLLNWGQSMCFMSPFPDATNLRSVQHRPKGACFPPLYIFFYQEHGLALLSNQTTSRTTTLW